MGAHLVLYYSNIPVVCQVLQTNTGQWLPVDSWTGKPSGTQWLVGTAPQRSRRAALSRLGVVHQLGGPCLRRG